VYEEANMVQLKEFVQSSLVQIIEAVKGAQGEVEKLGGGINPVGLSGSIKDRLLDPNTRQYSEMIEFDIAVSASEEASSKGRIGVVVAAIGLGVQHRTGESTSALSRIKFNVPVMFPAGKHHGS
jgi:hypothetical protein